MPNETQVVNEEVSAPSTEPVIDPQTETPVPESAPQETPAPQVSQPVATPVQDLDERGIPWRNRAMENERKFRELEERIKVTEQTAQPKKYSIQELESFALNNPEHRPWVEEEKAKVLREQIIGEVSQRNQAQEQARQFDTIRQQSFNSVINNSDYDGIAIKDSNGRFISWNMANPLTQEIARIMQDKRIESQPDAIEIASEIAYGRLARAKAPQSAQQVSKLKAQVKKVEQRTFVEGGGKPVSVNSNPIRKAVEQFKTTGNKKDAQEAFKEMFKAQGILKE